MTKTAVILFNLGGPDSKEAIEPFLFNFFMDKNIVRLPKPARWLLAKRISKSRSKREAGESYGFLGNKSPLLENTAAQALALENALNEGGVNKAFKVFVCMRYWKPMADQVVRAVKTFVPDKILLLPLYPQFSTTTTRSSFQDWDRAMKKIDFAAPTSKICCYPFNESFIKTSADNIREKYELAQKEGHKNPRILFSAHGLPEKIVKDGDPYQWQCEQGASRIANDLGIENLDWQICYQSRVGRLKWIGPSLDEALERAAADKKAVVIYPHAFTQEHVETLVELDIEYKKMADKLDIPGYYRAQTVGTDSDFIEGLATLVRQHLNKEGIHPEGFKSFCPAEFGRCCVKKAA